MVEELKLGSKIHSYEKNGWFNEGEVVGFKDNKVQVDFLDWIQEWHFPELILSTSMYETIFLPACEGIRLITF